MQESTAALVTASTINLNNLTPVLYKEKPVITTELLAQVYETEEKNIQMNFLNNKERFLEGVHYFKLQGDALKELKKGTQLNLVTSPFTSVLTLWTEKGASRHCKMLDTEKAWQRFDELEDTYFKVKEVKEILKAKDSYMIEDPVERAMKWVEEQKEKREALQSVNRIVAVVDAQAERINNLEPYKEYVDGISDSKTLHTTNVIAAGVGMSAVTLNKHLHDRGIIYSQGKGDKKVWLLTSEYRDKGIAKMVIHRYFDSEGNPQTTNYLKWTEKGRQLIYNMHYKYKDMSEARQFINS